MQTIAWWEQDELASAISAARRILVAGNAGAGKSTLCDVLHEVTGIEYTELDSLYFGPDWTKLASFEVRACVLAESENWITEWQYPVAREALAERANLFIWLDLPRHTTIRRVIARSIRRHRDRTALWNGNVERPLHMMLSNRYHTARWAFRHHHELRELVRRHAGDACFDVVHIRSTTELTSFTTAVRACGDECA